MFKEAGIVLGKERKQRRGQGERIFCISQDEHALILGQTRSGKSRTVVLPSIGALGMAGESMVISDPKSELYGYTAPFLERLGYRVVALDFKNPRKSSQYNFLEQVVRAARMGDHPKAINCAWDITTSLVGESKGEKIWSNGEASVIASSILAVVYGNLERPEVQNLANVYHFIAEMSRPISGEEIPLTHYIQSLEEGHPSRSLMAIAEVAPFRTRASFFTSALTTLRLFTSPLIQDMTSISDFDLSDIGKEKTAVFIILPDDTLTYYSLASLFINQLYSQLVIEADSRGGRLSRRVNFLLDEFGNFTVIPAFSTKLTVGGGRGIRFNLFLQSLSQLDEKYGKEDAKTIAGNCGSWLYLRTNDTQTLKEVSERLGDYTVSSTSKSDSFSGGKARESSSSYSSNLMKRSLLTPDEVRKIVRPNTVVLTDKDPAIFYAPDLSEYLFNRLFGLGDIEWNRHVRAERERYRRERPLGELPLWGIWKEYQQPQQTQAAADGGQQKENEYSAYQNLFKEFDL